MTLVAAVTVGAVNIPVGLIVPEVAFQVTAVLVVPVSEALNCSCTAEARVTELGVIAMVIGGGEAGITAVLWFENLLCIPLELTAVVT